MPQVPYCTSADLLLPSQALQELQSADIAQAIATASSEADTYLSTRWTLPLVAPEKDNSNNPIWPQALVNAVAQIAGYRAMLKRGYAPDIGIKDPFRDGYKDAIDFLKSVSKGDATLQVKGSNTNADGEEGGGPSSQAFVLQPCDGQSMTFDEQEDFWHDTGSVNGAANTFSGSGRRGY